MKSAQIKIFFGLTFALVLCLAAFGAFFSKASDGYFNFSVDYSKDASGIYYSASTVTANTGNSILMRLKTNWHFDTGCWPGTPSPYCSNNANGIQPSTTVVWKQDSCPAGATCYWYAHDASNSMSLTTTIAPNVDYTAPSLMINNLKAGTYTINFSVSEYSDACLQSGVSCLPPKTVTVVLVVTEPTPVGEIGNPDSFIASASRCGINSLSWTAGQNAGNYDIFRSGSNSLPGVPLVSGWKGTFYSDSTAVAGAPYFYWIKSQGAAADAVAANTNDSGGLEIAVCGSAPSAPAVLTAISSKCGQAVLSWNNVSGEDGYNIYRNQSGSAPALTDKVATKAANTTTYTDLVDHGTFYYWVSAYNASGESALRALNGSSVAVAICQADLSASDKDIRAINGAPQAISECDSNIFQGLPTGAVLKTGDVLGFEVNVCNQQGQANATEVIISDSLTNLSRPDTGWNAKLNGSPLVYVGANPSVGQYSYDSVLSQLTINAGTVSKGKYSQITYDAAVKPLPGNADVCTRCQNKAVINFQKDATGQTASNPLTTPAIFFSIK